MKISIVLAAMTGNFETDMNRASKTAQKRMKEIEKTAKQVGAAVGAAFVIAAGVVAAGTKRAIDRMDEIAKSAQKVGVTTEAFSKLAFAADLAGVEATALEGAMAKLARSQDDAARGTKETLDIFRALGVEFQNADGTLRKSDEVLADIADRFKALPDGANKTAAAMGLLGRSGAQLIPLLNGGNAGLKEAGDQLERLGGVVTPEAARQAEQFNDDLNRLSVAIDGVWLGVADRLLPDLISLTGAFSEGAQKGDHFGSVADDISASIATVAETAFRAYKHIELMTNGLVEMGARAVNAVASSPLSGVGLADRLFFDGSIARESGILADSSAQRAAEAAEAADFGLGLGSNFRAPLKPDAQGTREQTEAEKLLAAALEERRTAQARGAAAAKADTDAKRAAAEAARDAARAEQEAQDALESFLATTEDLTAELGGPMAQAQLEYIRREDELIRLAGLAGLSNEELASSLDLLEQARLRDVDAIQAQIDAEKAYQQAQKDAPLVRQMDALRDTTAGFFTDLVKNGKDAVDRLQDYLLTLALENVGRQIAAGLFGDFGTTGGGSAGGFGAILGSLFGGPRADGGPITPGKAYLVGEKGPELVMPQSAGTVLTARETAQAMGGRGMVVNNRFEMPGRYDLRTQAQVGAEAARSLRSVTSRATA